MPTAISSYNVSILMVCYLRPLLHITRKNKSFRPRERPKKGLKNLQSVKTLSAGQNLSNQTSAIKTRKQPLTVTAQFQNSLIALMETLNQVSYMAIYEDNNEPTASNHWVHFFRQTHSSFDVSNRIRIKYRTSLTMPPLRDRYVRECEPSGVSWCGPSTVQSMGDNRLFEL